MLGARDGVISHGSQLLAAQLGCALEQQDSDSGQHWGSVGPTMVPVNQLLGDGNDAGSSTLPVSGPWQTEKVGETLLCKVVCAAPNREVTIMAAKPADADRDYWSNAKYDQRLFESKVEMISAKRKRHVIFAWLNPVNVLVVSVVQSRQVGAWLDIGSRAS
ncbi:hypothetical protein BDN70DRAFT_901531 [Pholiota conissans]|uniref:Uncharacterized protein n=1 Tax=Pholiota conissans TaxID=109636 RepID=A0A9P6CRJ4_9AGAR|nr:hypothetical protein BDN70DRAFT_901531 [Pholiota conissans]